MLRLDLARLSREGSARVEASVPADDPLWQDSGVTFASPVDVRLRASYAGSGEVLVHGTLAAELEQECRRCLEPVAGRLVTEVTMAFFPSDMPGLEDDAEVRLFDPRVGDIDLREPVREEVILAIDPYVVCDPGCKGLCPQCGGNLNVSSCDCTRSEADPRWEVLRALKKE
jgi:uncharacterized protein